MPSCVIGAGDGARAARDTAWSGVVEAGNRGAAGGQDDSVGLGKCGRSGDGGAGVTVDSDTGDCAGTGGNRDGGDGEARRSGKAVAPSPSGAKEMSGRVEGDAVLRDSIVKSAASAAGAPEIAVATNDLRRSMTASGDASAAPSTALSPARARAIDRKLAALSDGATLKRAAFIRATSAAPRPAAAGTSVDADADGARDTVKRATSASPTWPAADS